MSLPLPFEGVWHAPASPTPWLTLISLGEQGLAYDLRGVDPHTAVQAHLAWGALPSAGGLTASLQGGVLTVDTFDPHRERLVRARHQLREDGTLAVEHTDARGSSTTVFARAQVKQVICYRRDLKMRKGKIAAQVAHASLGAVLPRGPSATPLQIARPLPGPVAWWHQRSAAKIVLSVEDEATLVRVHTLARQAGLPTCLVTDAGRTEFHGVPTRTTVAIGPWETSALDTITGPGGLVATKLA